MKSYEDALEKGLLFILASRQFGDGRFRKAEDVDLERILKVLLISILQEESGTSDYFSD